MPKGFFKRPKKETAAKQSANGKKGAASFWRKRYSIERMERDIERLKVCLVELATLQQELLDQIAKNEREIERCLEGDHLNRLRTPRKPSTDSAAPVNGRSK